MWVQQDNQVTDNNQHGGEVMRYKPMVNKIKAYLEEEVRAYQSLQNLQENLQATLETDQIHMGRAECAEGLLEQIKQWENE